jgi:hypothetical protein
MLIRRVQSDEAEKIQELMVIKVRLVDTEDIAAKQRGLA